MCRFVPKKNFLKEIGDDIAKNSSFNSLWSEDIGVVKCLNRKSGVTYELWNIISMCLIGLYITINVGKIYDNKMEVVSLSVSLISINWLDIINNSEFSLKSLTYLIWFVFDKFLHALWKDVREYRRDNQKWTIQRNWQHRVHRLEEKQTKTNNVNETWSVLHTTGGKCR